MDNKTTTNEEIVIENSENWFVSWQRRKDKLYVKHKVEKQYGMYAKLTFGEGVDTNSRQFNSAIELMKALILKEETWGG